MFVVNENIAICSQIASEGLKHRVVEVSLADLQGDEDHAYRKIRLRVEDVQGKNVLTNFWVCTQLKHLHTWIFRFGYKNVFEFMLFPCVICREWTLPPTSWDRLYGRGNLWLKLMLMSRHPTPTLWGCSALPSPRSVRISRRSLATQRPARFARWEIPQIVSSIVITDPSGSLGISKLTFCFCILSDPEEDEGDHG